MVYRMKAPHLKVCSRFAIALEMLYVLTVKTTKN